MVLGLSVGLAVLPTMEDQLYTCSDLMDDPEDDEETKAAKNESIRDSLSGIFSASFSLGAVIGPLVGGGVVQSVGFPWMATGVSAVYGLLALAVFIHAMLRGKACCGGGARREIEDPLLGP